MTLNDIFLRLRSIDCKAQSLISETGFDPSGTLGSQVRLEPGDPDDLFLRNAACHLLLPFEDLHARLNYLSKPAHGEYRIQKFPDGRYGYIDSQGLARIFTCGSTFEVLIPDDSGHLFWAQSRIEHDGSDYYLWRHSSVPLSGLTVRERR